jgi:coenzyme F420-0:L-glutamate ligase/coenzyme F420-1:gamma-L-glutamate ligase
MRLEILPVTGMPEVVEGDDVGALIAEHGPIRDGDVVVVAQKIVSKAEGRLVPVDPARRAEERARLVAEESVRVLARRGDLAIVETRHGYVCAQAGVDASNVPPDRLALLPVDPDASAGRIRARLRGAGVDVGVIVADTFGRPWRVGQTNVALGVAGIAPLRDHRGEKDAFGLELEATLIAVADELAAAAELVMGKSDGVPVAIVRGWEGARGHGSGRDLIRPADEDLFPTGLQD